MAGLTGSKRLGGSSPRAQSMTLAECRKRIAELDHPKKALNAAEQLELRRLNTKLKSSSGLVKPAKPKKKSKLKAFVEAIVLDV